MLRNALAAAMRARLVVTIPGTKCIELAALGVPMIAITPLNAPEIITFNGPLTYLNRMPLVGVPLKRAVAVGVSRRFVYHTQPNMDAGEALICELHGTLTPGPGRAGRLGTAGGRSAWLARSRQRLVGPLPRITWGRRTGWPNRSLRSPGRKTRRIANNIMRISIVIATKDRAAYLERALASLEQQIGAPSFEAIVVDNGSSDDTKGVAERQSARGAIPVTTSSSPNPIAAKRATAASRSPSGYLVLFIDDDVQLPPGFLAAHEAAHSTSNLVVNGPILNVPSYDDAPQAGARELFARVSCARATSRFPSTRSTRSAGSTKPFVSTAGKIPSSACGCAKRGCAGSSRGTRTCGTSIPGDNTLEVETRKAMERARMAQHFLDKAALAARAHGDRRASR